MSSGEKINEHERHDYQPHTPKEDMDKFMNEQFTRELLIAEVGAPGNIFIVAEHNGTPAGYVRLRENNNPPERVRVYEEIKAGIWSYNGVFHLIDSWIEPDQNGHRVVFKFKLVAVEDDEDFSHEPIRTPQRRRIIPTSVKLKVWQRDGGKCIECGSTDELHFDHDLPYAKGGTSITEANVQLLCARHNLEKSDRIR